MLAVDASVAIEAALGRLGLEALERRPLVAPRLLWSEAPSALHELTWRGVLPTAHAAEALARLHALPVRREDPDGLIDEAWRVADSLGWAKTYDAEYVALARLLACPLITIDGRLARGAAGVVEVVAPADV